MIALTVGFGVLVAILAVALVLERRPRRAPGQRPGAPRILVPFTGSSLDPTVLNAAIRLTQAEEAVLVPAYLLVVPFEYPEDSPLQKEVSVAIPLLEAVEHAALRAGVPVDARIEKGRTATHALRRLWEVESFDRLVVPARAGGHDGFDPKELAWLLTHAPIETLVLRPSPNGSEPAPRRRPRSRKRRRALAAAH